MSSLSLGDLMRVQAHMERIEDRRPYHFWTSAKKHCHFDDWGPAKKKGGGYEQAVHSSAKQPLGVLHVSHEVQEYQRGCGARESTRDGVPNLHRRKSREERMVQIGGAA